jgi:iron complex transport system substrate-binding protein
MKYLLSIIFISLLFISCKEEKKQHNTVSLLKSTIKYAKGFDIVIDGNQKKLIIKKPYQNAKKYFTFIVGNKTDLDKNLLKVPVQNIVVTSTTHIPMLELIGVENTISGFPQTKFISSEKTRKLIDNGHIVELGVAQNINTEKLLELSPELVVGFSLNGTNKIYNTILKSKIPVIFNGDWLEETPLGRAEWIKFFGVLFNKEKKADSIFNEIEKNYLTVKKLALEAKNRPTILSGSLFNDIWYIPAGKSFIAQFFKDANTNYLWSDTKGAGSLPLSIESVLDKAQNTDYWIGCGLLETKNELKTSNRHYASFSAFKRNDIYTFASKKGKTGGLIYFEYSPIRPDLVLKDIIKITHPELLIDYTPTFFSKMN